MENAADATARAVVFRGNASGKSVLVLCGKGNNGGDGAAAARLLATAGAKVDVILVGAIKETKGDALENFRRLELWHEDRARHEHSEITTAGPGVLNLFECDSEKGWQQLVESVLNASPDAVIDALFGTGLTRPVEGLYLEAIRYVTGIRAARDQNQEPGPVIISVDLPSGLNSEAEQINGDAVRADVTVTMTAPKRANVVPPAAHHNGHLIVAAIGSPPN
jgi:NAD(P)H-hydrate epimerase